MFRFLRLLVASLLFAPTWAEAQNQVHFQTQPTSLAPVPFNSASTVSAFQTTSVQTSLGPVIVQPASVQGVANAVTHAAGLAGHVLWIDASANIDTTATREGIAALVSRAKTAHINTLVVDVKGISGEVIYDSKIAPHLAMWKGKKYDSNFDRLAVFVTEAKKNGMSVLAAMNTFAEGHKMFSVGPGYSHTDWQDVAYNVKRTLTAANGQTVEFPTTPDEMAPLGKVSVLSPDAAANILKPEGVWAVLDESGKVLLVGEAALVASTPKPKGSRLIVGRGAASDWVTTNIRIGETVKFSATPTLVKIADASWEKVGLFVSPHNPDVRAYEMSIAREIAQNYGVSGIVFDRMRYSNLSTDFSDKARADFEKYIGHPIENWPQDIFSYADDPFAPRIEGPLFKKWLEFRSATIQSFVQETSDTVRAVRPDIQLGVYVGSWYSDYYPVGVNWAANDFNAGYDWMTPEYFRTGYAKSLDWVTTGCYYPIATRADAEAIGADPQATVESAAALSNQAINDAAFLYAGLYIEDYKGKSKNLPGKPEDYLDKPEAFVRAIATAKATTQGVMIFDAVHLDTLNWWRLLGEALGADATAPDAVPGLLDGVRATSGAMKKARFKDGITQVSASQVPISETP